MARTRKPDERRPFVHGRNCLTPDLFLKAIPELVGKNKAHLRRAQEVIKQIERRRARGINGIESILERTLDKESYKLMPEAKDYATYLSMIAKTLPPYTSEVITQELKARARELGVEELRLRRREVNSALQEVRSYATWQTQKMVAPGVLRRIEELAKVPVRIGYYARTRRGAPRLGEPVAVSWRIKTLESIARKAFRKIVERIGAKEAKRINKLIQQGASVEKLAAAFKPYLTNLQFEDTNGLLFVYTTLESKTKGVDRFVSSVSARNGPGNKIEDADLGGREKEDYSLPEKQKPGRPYEATHHTLVVPVCSPDFVEVHFNTLYGALTAAFGETRNNHQLYEQRKSWKRPGWTDDHFAIYEKLLEFAEQVYGRPFPPSA